ncbi:hypothetical protein E3P99_02393 [Wallemia hederae]|uniref:F-actin-capping protein subunit alpha n=1 Tax=Wallemia hederae TaxID=1540922 RepID=A0A4T0FMR0_9BASI|nr:hypothetical protein E3P99_02393 [Wallemia hederae]
MSNHEIVRKIIKQSPPNEITDVLENLKVLTEIDADELNKCLKEFNEEQMSSVDIDGVKTLITAQSQLDEHRYYDPKTSKVYSINHRDLKANDVETVEQLSRSNDTRSLFEQPLNDYVKEHLANGTAAVFTPLKQLKRNVEAPASQTEPAQVESQQPAQDTKVEETSEKTETKEGEESVSVDNDAQENKADEEPSETNEGEQAREEQDEKDKQDDQEKEEQVKQDSDTVIPEADAQNTQQSESTESEDISAITIYYTGNKFNQSNYWSGRWTAKWVYDLSSNELTGNIDVTIHYFENGNVQLQASHKPQIKSPINGPPTTVEEARKIVKSISESDRQYQAYLNVLYEDKLSEKLFRSLRRALPITREKIDWDKVVNYKIGTELGKLNN